MQEMVNRMETIKTNLTATQTRMKEYVDMSGRLETFCKGTKVLLSTRNLQVDFHLLSKLRKWWIGPYKVIEVISPIA